MRVLYLSDYFDTPYRALAECMATQPGLSVTAFREAGRACQFTNQVVTGDFLSRGKMDFSAIRDLRAKVVYGQFDLIHATNSRMLANALLATRKLGPKPQVCGFMGHVGHFSWWNPVDHLTYLHPRLAGVWCNCRAVAEPLAQAGISRDKLFVIHTGHPFHARSLPPNLEVRRELGIPPAAIVVGFAGNMRPVKGVDLLLRAADKLLDITALHWLLLGRIQDRQVHALLQRTTIGDRIHCLGWRSDVERLMTAMDIFAMPSRSEGFSRSVSEAMEIGLCVVATSAGGTPELVRDGVDGLLTPAEDVNALASAIRRVALNKALRTSLAESARERIRTQLTVENMSQQMLAMYRTILSGCNGNKRRAA